MSTPRSNFPDEIWDGSSVSRSNPLDDKLDFQINDQQAAEIRAVQQYLIDHVDVLRLLGNPNTILGVRPDGLALEYKDLVAGSNVSIIKSSGSITISASGGGGGDTTNSAETDSNISAGMLAYIKANTHVDLASSDNQATTQAAGMAIEDKSATEAVAYATDGQLTLGDWTAATGATDLVPGADYFLTTAGQMSTTPPSSGSVVRVGRAVNTMTFDIEISSPIRL